MSSGDNSTQLPGLLWNLMRLYAKGLTECMGLKSINVGIIIFIMHLNLKITVFPLCRIIHFNNMDWSFPSKYTMYFRTEFFKQREVLQVLNMVNLIG